MNEGIKGKRTLIIATVGILCLLIVSTFLSKSIYNATLPAVEVMELSSGELTADYTGVGRVEYTDLQVLRASVPLRVTAINKKVQARVDADDVLFEVDISEYELQAAEMELSIRQLESQLTPEGLSSAQVSELLAERELVVEEIKQATAQNPSGMGGSEEYEMNIKRLELDLLRIDNQLNPSGLNGQQLELLREQRSILEQKLDLFRASYPADGLIYAGVSGVLKSVNATVGATVQADSVIAEIVPTEATPNVVITVPSVQAEQLSAGDKATITYSVVDLMQKEGLRTEILDKKIATKEYDAQTGDYKFTIPLKAGEGSSSGVVSVRLIKSFGWYDKVVPLSAVYGMEDNYSIYELKSRDGLFGEEWYVTQVSANKLMENSLYMAIDCSAMSSGQEYVASSTGMLADGASVRVVRP